MTLCCNAAMYKKLVKRWHPVHACDADQFSQNFGWWLASEEEEKNMENMTVPAHQMHADDRANSQLYAN